MTQRAHQRRAKPPDRRDVERKLACLAAHTIGSEQLSHRPLSDRDRDFGRFHTKQPDAAGRLHANRKHVPAGGESVTSTAAL